MSFSIILSFLEKSSEWNIYWSSEIEKAHSMQEDTICTSLWVTPSYFSQWSWYFLPVTSQTEISSVPAVSKFVFWEKEDTSLGYHYMVLDINITVKAQCTF